MESDPEGLAHALWAQSGARTVESTARKSKFRTEDRKLPISPPTAPNSYTNSAPAAPKFTSEYLDQILEFERFLKSKRYSPSTIKTYCDAIKVFLKFYNSKPLEDISNKDIITFNNESMPSNYFF